MEWDGNCGGGKAKEVNRHSPRSLHTRTRLSSLLRLNLDSRHYLRPGSILLQSSFSSCAAPLQTEASMGGLQGQHR
ncbi:hypothetical protein TNCV_2227901 [Trichonephila clavipes]|nr:hypothetical protein TNCV_2227901 [Trichonephila clavipes]